MIWTNSPAREAYKILPGDYFNSFSQKSDKSQICEQASLLVVTALKFRIRTRL
jgi:hypothetical protein